MPKEFAPAWISCGQKEGFASRQVGWAGGKLWSTGVPLGRKEGFWLSSRVNKDHTVVYEQAPGLFHTNAPHTNVRLA